MADIAPLRNLRAQCLCTRSSLTFAVPISSLPLRTHFCHCSICRHTHGTLCTIHAFISPPAFNPDTFTTYKSSIATRYFCSTCGAHMMDYGEGNWCLATSLVEGDDENLWKFTEHIFLDATGDGGVGGLLDEINGSKLDKWKERDESSGEWMPSPSSSQSTSSSTALQASCYCKGVQFSISRPTPNTHDPAPENLTPTDRNKWFAVFCFCTSCRLASGCAIMPWTFLTTDAITLLDGSPYRPVFGTAKLYESSRGIARTFCGTCGATLAYHTDERPGMVDIAVGLLETKNSLDRGWLEWRTHRLAKEEDAVWHGLKSSLKEGLRKLKD
ncbi:hypothetical protein GQ43DRAFT_418327 [Delitschia confertaspora ATCC 74209]|uniref:CENP-V/GFA domain-containing protein n=1 Tax=Delitschia confertaspora ATCC 74209 TaxID=1513339 RepID=A0A9P4MXX0_9PLEO|nr:hypothetical protein GQ43DRAFT_418327 [Delitschia confertaspora ATCC 74209]